MSFWKTKKIALATIIGSSLSISLLFQNCSEVRFQNAPISQESLQGCTDPECDEIIDGDADCSFNDVVVPHTTSVTAFLSSTVPFGSMCVSESRTCNNGQLSGSYTYPSCAVDQPASCMFNGKMVAHGASVDAFVNSTVPFGSSCDSEKRICNNGVLSGTYAFATCAPEAPKSCLFNGQTIAHGSVVRGYQNSAVPFGATCDSELRLCNNGTLNGSFAFGSCTVGQPASCMFNGQTLPHGATVPAFQNSTVAYGAKCVQETRTCTNGSLSGSFTFPSCNVNAPATCLFNGVAIASGSSVDAFQNSTVAYGAVCMKETRNCVNGQLSGSFTFPSCNVAAPASCMFNGMSIASGQTVRAYQSSNVGFGMQCAGEDRLCTNGSLSGSFTFGSCTVGQPASCMFNGQTIAHGSSVNSYPSSTVPYGSTCVPQSRVCTNGSLSGSAQFASCSVDGPKSCMFNGQTIVSGSNIVAYQSSMVEFGNMCVSEVRSCVNGTLSGSFGQNSCVVGPPKSCTFNGNTIAHGASTVAYSSSVVPFGSTCTGETRVCSNGNLSGSATFSSCQVANPLPCTFNGQSVPHGNTVTAYQSTSVPYGSTCASQARVCSNGVLSGSYLAPMCSVLPIPQSTESFTGNTEKLADRVDILFVLDESISMDAIIAKVRTGFAGLTSNQYPMDTKMAVTNMAPALYTDVANRTFDATKPFVTAKTWIPSQPGFLKLVDGSSIQSFKAAQPGRSAPFTEPGCSAWFNPLDKNSNGVPCISANTQVSLQPTDIEAGVMTLEQLVKLNASKATRTFRSGAIANIVFVSDTHDAGGEYYGKPGAVSSMLDYGMLKDLITVNNSGLLGVKFNGIVPLPPAGDSLLNGLTIAGPLPTSTVINSEGTNGYSYLPLIRSSSGVVMHSTNTDWNAAIQKMVSQMNIAKNPIVILAKPAVSILSVTVNGSVLAASEYTLSSDKKTLEITKRAGWPTTVAISVSYTHLP